jgi:hypothetical protein
MITGVDKKPKGLIFITGVATCGTRTYGRGEKFFARTNDFRPCLWQQRRKFCHCRRRCAVIYLQSHLCLFFVDAMHCVSTQLRVAAMMGNFSYLKVEKSEEAD